MSEPQHTPHTCNPQSTNTTHNTKTMRACVSRGGQDRLQFALTLLLLCGTKDFLWSTEQVIIRCVIVYVDTHTKQINKVQTSRTGRSQMGGYFASQMAADRSICGLLLSLYCHTRPFNFRAIFKELILGFI